MNIGVCGLGKLGFPLALAIERKGHRVFGYDVRPEAMVRKMKTAEVYESFEDVAESEVEFVDSIHDLVVNAEIIFVAVQTPNYAGYDGTNKVWGMERKDYDYHFLEKAIGDISAAVEAHGRKKIIVVTCTVLPGTCRQRVKPLLGPHSKLVYNPFTVAMGTVVRDFYHQEFYIVGIDDPWAKEKVVQFYKTISNANVYATGLENAELIKVLYNTFITMKICFANSVMEICHKIPGADCDQVMGALKLATNRLISTHYLSGGMVDAGPCHPKDLRSLWFLAGEVGLSFDLFDALVYSVERQSEWLALLIATECAGLPVVLLGKAFKENINLDTGSAVYLLRECLAEQGVKIAANIDPHVDGEDAAVPLETPCCYVLCTKHEYFFDLEFPTGSVVIDVFRWLPAQPGVKYIKVGVGEPI